MRIALGHVVRLMPEHPLERAAAKIHILPLQIQDLALPHPGIQSKYDRRRSRHETLFLARCEPSVNFIAHRFHRHSMHRIFAALRQYPDLSFLIGCKGNGFESPATSRAITV